MLFAYGKLESKPITFPSNKSGKYKEDSNYKELHRRVKEELFVENPWMAEILDGMSRVKSCAMEDVQKAFENYFRIKSTKAYKETKAKAKKKKRKSDLFFPKYKASRRDRKRIKFKLEGQDDFQDDRIWFNERVGWVKLKENLGNKKKWFKDIRHFIDEKPPEKTRILSVVISEKNDRWYISIQYQRMRKRIVQTEKKELKKVGIDVGLDSGMLKVHLSDGRVIYAKEYMPEASHIKKLIEKSKELDKQRSRKRCPKKGREPSHNWVSVNCRANRNKEKIARITEDIQYKMAVGIAQRYDVICVEKLKLKDMQRKKTEEERNDMTNLEVKISKNIRKSFQGASVSQFLSLLKNKAERGGKTFVEVNPKNTTQMCSRCGNVKSERIGVEVREYRCEKCGLVMDRDANAARNILQRGEQLVSEQGVVIGRV